MLFQMIVPSSVTCDSATQLVSTDMLFHMTVPLRVSFESVHVMHSSRHGERTFGLGTFNGHWTTTLYITVGPGINGRYPNEIVRLFKRKCTKYVSAVFQWLFC